MNTYPIRIGIICLITLIIDIWLGAYCLSLVDRTWAELPGDGGKINTIAEDWYRKTYYLGEPPKVE